MRIYSVNAGRPRLVQYRDHVLSTAIEKRPLSGPQRVTTEGLAGDGHGNPRVHGGPQLALCAFPHEHYDYFAQRIGRALHIPSFGENLTTDGLLENEACIGDIYRIGTVKVQISQPREPCSTVVRRNGWPDLAAVIHQTCYCGFYLRVLEEGELAAGDTITRVDRPHEGMTVELAMRAMFDEPVPMEWARRFSECQGLSPKWVNRMRKRAGLLVET